MRGWPVAGRPFAFLDQVACAFATPGSLPYWLESELRVTCALDLIRSGSDLPMFYPQLERNSLIGNGFRAAHFR